MCLFWILCIVWGSYNSFGDCLTAGIQRIVDKGLTSFSSREKLNARIILVHGRIILLQSFLANTSQSKSISLHDERNLIPLRGDSVERGKKNKEGKLPSWKRRVSVNTVNIQKQRRVSFVVRNALLQLHHKLLRVSFHETANSPNLQQNANKIECFPFRDTDRHAGIVLSLLLVKYKER